MEDNDLKKIEMRPIGFVRRTSSNEDVRDRSLVSEIVLVKGLAQASDSSQSDRIDLGRAHQAGEECSFGERS